MSLSLPLNLLVYNLSVHGAIYRHPYLSRPATLLIPASIRLMLHSAHLAASVMRDRDLIHTLGILKLAVQFVRRLFIRKPCKRIAYIPAIKLKPLAGIRLQIF